MRSNSTDYVPEEQDTTSEKRVYPKDSVYSLRSSYKEENKISPRVLDFETPQIFEHRTKTELPGNWAVYLIVPSEDMDWIVAPYEGALKIKEMSEARGMEVQIVVANDNGKPRKDFRL